MPQHVYMLLSVKNSPYNYYVFLELLFHIEKTIYIQFKTTKNSDFIIKFAKTVWQFCETLGSKENWFNWRNGVTVFSHF